MRASPAHALFAQDAAHLAAPNLDALRLGGGRQRIERPVRDVPTLATGRSEGPVGIGEQSPRWGAGDQGTHGAAFGLGEAWLAPTARLHAQSVEPALVKGMEPLAHGLRMAAQLLSDGSRAQAIPTAHNHPRMPHPIGGGVMAPRPTSNLVVFRGIHG
jgi:hypothetical protein